MNNTPHTSHTGFWKISELDLLHLFSVKIGATYTSIADAAKRCKIDVDPFESILDEETFKKVAKDFIDNENDEYHSEIYATEKSISSCVIDRFHNYLFKESTEKRDRYLTYLKLKKEFENEQ